MLFKLMMYKILINIWPHCEIVSRHKMQECMNEFDWGLTHTDFSARSIIIKSPTWAPVPLEGAISFILYAYSIYIYLYLCPLSLRSTFAKLGTYHRGNRSKFSMSYIQTPWGPSTHSALNFFFWKNPLFKFRAVHFSLIQSWQKN